MTSSCNNKRHSTPTPVDTQRRQLTLATGLGLLSAFAPLATHAQTSGKEVVVGQLVSVSNPGTKVTAVELQAGVELAQRHINAAGGIQGRPLKVVLLDDEFNPSKTVAMAEELVRKYDALALVACLGTQTTLRLAQEGTLEKNRLANFGPFTGLRKAQTAANVFPVRASFDDEAKAMFVHAASLGRKNISFLYLKAGAGPELSLLAQQWADGSGAKLLNNTGLDVKKTPNEQRQECEGVLAAWGNQAPDAVVLIGFGAAQSAAIRALRGKYGNWLPIYALGQINIDTLLTEIGAEAARGISLTQVMPSPVSVGKRICREYANDRLRWKPDLKPTYMMLEGYVTARIMAEVMRRARTLTREGVLESALAAGEMNVADFRVSYAAAARKSLQPVDITVLGREGQLVR